MPSTQDTPDRTSINRRMVALVGNPNVGKSALFNLLTGKYVIVSNYPGTTVEVSTGTMRVGATHVTVVDTPGVNSLTPRSEDERVTRDILLERPLCAVIQVADAKNLRRALMITAQLAEMQLPVTLALNMWDEALDRGIHIGVSDLAHEVGVPVVCTVATQRQGIRELIDSVERARVPGIRVDYGPAIEEALIAVERCLSSASESARGLALMVLSEEPEADETSPESGILDGGQDRENDDAGGGRRRFRHRARRRWGIAEPSQIESVNSDEQVRAIREGLQRAFADPLSFAISQKRSAHLEQIISKVTGATRTARGSLAWREAAVLWASLPIVLFLIGFKLAELAAWPFAELRRQDLVPQWVISVIAGAVFASACMLHLLNGVKSRPSLRHQLGDLTMHPVFAFPVLAFVLWLLYKIVGQFGAGTCVDFLQNSIFRAHVIPFLESWACRAVPETSLVYQLLFSSDAGLISVGLTYSLAIVMPIVGFFFLAFGLLEDSGYLPRLAVMLDRLFKKVGLTGKAALPMVLGLGCATMATLTTRILDTRKQRTIAIFLLALAVPCSAQLGVISAVLGRVSGTAFAIYVLVIASQLLLVGYLAAKVIPGEQTDFMIEIPPFRVPEIRNIVVKTFHRLHWFLREAVPLFLMGTFILFVLTKLGILRLLEAAASPLVVSVLELPKETTAGFILGFLRRDYGVISIFAALDKAQHGQIASSDLLVALTVMTLFVPCLANFFVMIKESGMKRAGLMVAFIFPYAFLVGGVLRWVLKLLRM